MYVYVHVCVSVRVSVHMCIYACTRVCTRVYPHPCFPCTGPSECYCGKYSLLDTCRTPARATKRSWSSSPAEDGWTPRRTALGLCMPLLGTFLQVTKHSSPFQKASAAPCALLRWKGRWLASLNAPLMESVTPVGWVSLPAPKAVTSTPKRCPLTGGRPWAHQAHTPQECVSWPPPLLPNTIAPESPENRVGQKWVYVCS